MYTVSKSAHFQNTYGARFYLYLWSAWTDFDESLFKGLVLSPLTEMIDFFGFKEAYDLPPTVPRVPLTVWLLQQDCNAEH